MTGDLLVQTARGIHGSRRDVNEALANGELRKAAEAHQELNDYRDQADFIFGAYN